MDLDITMITHRHRATFSATNDDILKTKSLHLPLINFKETQKDIKI